ncbi:hypothetical protein HDG32_000685 [Paraburkholderia sp. CI2]|uniref:hypothetical protein n=1 Tax=Paraburkholderia sp. CI2 TaxID=2723093 RepID=UPI00162054E8|nr:hypothetical protein [Paraburkholderia sp. CI2]MBB5464592.1 hypothetical protein [Paraburkholderia sp. CI2]
MSELLPLPVAKMEGGKREAFILESVYSETGGRLLLSGGFGHDGHALQSNEFHAFEFSKPWHSSSEFLFPAA